MGLLKKKSSLGGDMVNLTASKIAVTLITLVNGMLLSRFRTLEEYGTYSQLLLVINLATTIIMMGLPNSLNYFLAKADDDRQRRDFLSVYYSLSTALSIILGIVLLVITPFLVKYFNNPLITSFMYFLAVYPWTKIIASGIENILVVYKKTGGIIFFRIANSIAVLGVIAIVRLFNWNFSAYMLIYLIVEVVFAIAVYIIAAKLSGGIHFSFNTSLIKEIFKFSIPIGLASMVGTLNIEIDKLMIGNFLDTEQLAIYTNASKEMPIAIVASSITAVLLPQMVKILKKGDNLKAVELWGSAVKISFSVICFCSAVLFAFALEVMTVLYSEKYLPGVPVFRVYSLVLLFRFTYWGMVLNAVGKTKFIFYSSVASLGLNTVLNYLLFKTLGIIGPAIATLLALVIVATVQLIFTARILNISFANIFPWFYMLKEIVLHGIIAIVMYLLKLYIPLDRLFETNGNVIEAIVFGFIWILIFALIELNPIKQEWNKLNSNEVI